MTNLQEKSRWLIQHFKKEWQIYVLLAPAMIWFFVFLYTPMYGLQIAFKDYSMFKGISLYTSMAAACILRLFLGEMYQRLVSR